MDSHSSSLKFLSLDEIKKVIDSLGLLSENTLCSHSLALIINKSGEATFTSSCWKVLNECDYNCPLTKVICKAALKYTEFCGEDCKYFLFILREMFCIICNKLNRGNELHSKHEIINEIFSFKRILPNVYESIRNMPDKYENNLDSTHFSESLKSVVLTSMLSKFTNGVSKVLSDLICNFVLNIGKKESLNMALSYVLSHFDIFCCKTLSQLSDSQVVEGILLYTSQPKHCDLNLENVKFLVIWDLKMKVDDLDVTWEIKDESFILQLNSMHMYKKVFSYFKSQGIMLIITPSTCDKNLKLLCEKSGISIIDQINVEEIKHVLFCYQLCPLEDLNEALESKHIAILSYAKFLSFNKSHFLHLKCTHIKTDFNAHHIVLCAPSNAMWKEYYSECLNCLKMVLCWLSSQSDICYHEKINYKAIEENSTKFPQPSKVFLNSKVMLELSKRAEITDYVDTAKANFECGRLLPPCSWELMFKIAVENVMSDTLLPCNVILQAAHVAITKCICRKIDVPFTSVKEIEQKYDQFLKKFNAGEVILLEPLLCKEIMINSVLDLILQLLKTDSIVFIK